MSNKEDEEGDKLRAFLAEYLRDLEGVKKQDKLTKGFMRLAVQAHGAKYGTEEYRISLSKEQNDL